MDRTRDQMQTMQNYIPRLLNDKISFHWRKKNEQVTRTNAKKREQISLNKEKAQQVAKYFQFLKNKYKKSRTIA